MQSKWAVGDGGIVGSARSSLTFNDDFGGQTGTANGGNISTSIAKKESVNNGRTNSLSALSEVNGQIAQLEAEKAAWQKANGIGADGKYLQKTDHTHDADKAGSDVKTTGNKVEVGDKKSKSTGTSGGTSNSGDVAASGSAGGTTSGGPAGSNKGSSSPVKGQVTGAVKKSVKADATEKTSDDIHTGGTKDSAAKLEYKNGETVGTKHAAGWQAGHGGDRKESAVWGKEGQLQAAYAKRDALTRQTAENEGYSADTTVTTTHSGGMRLDDMAQIVGGAGFVTPQAGSSRTVDGINAAAAAIHQQAAGGVVAAKAEVDARAASREVEQNRVRAASDTELRAAGQGSADFDSPGVLPAAIAGTAGAPPVVTANQVNQELGGTNQVVESQKKTNLDNVSSLGAPAGSSQTPGTSTATMLGADLGAGSAVFGAATTVAAAAGPTLAAARAMATPAVRAGGLTWAAGSSFAVGGTGVALGVAGSGLGGYAVGTLINDNIRFGADDKRISDYGTDGLVYVHNTFSSNKL